MANQADKTQSLNIAATKRIISNFKKDSEKRYGVAYFETRLEKLQQQWRKCEEMHAAAHQALEKTPDRLMEYNDEYESLENLVLEYVTLFRSKMYEYKGSMESTAVESVKLERIRIPTFNGQYASWFSFRDLYKTMVHDNSQLNSVQKLQYLRNAVKDDAEKLISHLTITAANYNVAWKLLSDRYDNHRAIAQEVLQRFWEVQKCGTNDINGFKRVLDVTHQLEACLQAIDGESFDVMTIFILNQKLDEETRKDWQKEISGISTMPTLSTFLEFIQKRLMMLEALSGSSKSMIKRAISVHTSHVEVKQSCPKCKASHRLLSCDSFKQLELQARRNFVSSKQLCFNCLSDKHKVTGCTSKHKCKTCGKRHHSLLHSDEARKPVNTTVEVKAQCAQANHAHEPTNVLLSTAIIRVQKRTGEIATLRALLDTGAQRSFITTSAVKHLGIQTKKVNASILGVGGNQKLAANGLASITALVKNENGKSENIKFKPLVLEKITALIPSLQVAYTLPDGIKQSDLADPSFNVPGEIDILIGVDVYGRILLPEFRTGNPCAQNTKFGWVLFGPTAAPSKPQPINALISFEEFDSHLKQFWEIEDITDDKSFTADEVLAEKHYTEHYQRTDSGRYMVSLPFKSREELSSCETTKIAQIQFRRLEQALIRNPDLYAQYKEFMEEYIRLGHMQLIPSTDINTKPSYYLPHHAVMKNSSSTTKLRVVFNASQKGKGGKALNDIILTGPPIQQHILHVLMRWRQHRYVIAADIEKMYRQIWINEEDVDCQRILWRSNPEEPIRHYHLKTVTYGTSSAPFLAIRTLQQLAKDELSRYPEAAAVILRDFYVDDVLTGADDLDTLIKLQAELRHVMKSGGFHLRKWTSNHPDLLKHIPPEDRETQMSFDIYLKGAVKTLGLQWHPGADHFTFSINRNVPKEITKRNILSEVFKLFDPLGWIQPCIVIGKITVQKLWLMKCDWDDTLREEDVEDWLTVHKQLPALNKLKIPRWIGCSNQDQFELHGFCDASSLAYAAVVYLKVKSPSIVRINLVTSKAKVAPVKTRSIPRLELCGAELLVDLMDQVVQAHNWKHVPKFYWTDSSIVLDWIRSPASKWKVFIANRVGSIQRRSSSQQWHHVATKDNPADLASRGVFPKDLVDSTQWWNGPSWLKTFTPKSCCLTSDDEEHGSIHQVTLAIDKSTLNPEILGRFSCIRRLKRVVALCQRFSHNTRNTSLKRTGDLTNDELKDAEILCIRLAQTHAFHEEIQHLQRSNTVPDSSKLRHLAPWLDTDGVLRVGGRIYHALIGEERKHPAIIPKGALAQLLIKEAHLQTLHGGVLLTLSTVRLKYWIISGHTITRSILKNCITCFKMTAKPNEQLMGLLPPARVRFEKPFLETGVDYAGPINIRWSTGRGSKTSKAYVVIFVCMATKAFHLELASDLSTPTCLAAIRRFIARRGKCRTIFSDCGTNFRGAQKQLKEEYDKVTRKAGAELAQENIEWKFIPPGSPHFGGLWEAGVKSMKRHLYKTIGQQILTIEEFNTLLAQIEACLNSRPLTDISSDPSDVSALTPGHFLTGSKLFEIKSDPSECDATLLRRWKLVQYMKHSFWHRWSRDYLNRLQQRPKWLTPRPNIKEGDIVLVKTANIPSMQWPLAKVVATHPGVDGLVRVVTLKLNGKLTKRAITKVCSLPFNHEINETSNEIATTPNSLSQPAADISSFDAPAEKAHPSLCKRSITHENQSEPKHKKAKSKSVNLATVVLSTLLVLGCCIPPSSSTVTISPLKGGLYIEHVGIANLLRGALQLHFKVPLADLKLDEQNIGKVNESVQIMCKSAQKVNDQIHCWDLYQHLSELCRESIDRINTLRFLHSRKTRGLLGQMLTSLFGVNDEVIMDINSLNENQEKLKQLVLKQGKVVLKATTTLNSTASRINKKLSRFSEQLQQGLNEINKSKEWFTKIDHNQLNIRFLALYEHARNYISDVFHKYDSILRTIHTKSGIWECVKLADLESAIYNLQPLLTTHLEIVHAATAKVATTYEGDCLQLTGQLPIIDNRKYDIVKTSAIPIQENHDVFTIFDINSTMLGINYDDELYFDTTENDIFNAMKINTNHYLLSAATLIDLKMRPNCMIREIYNSYTGERCPIKTFKLLKPVWKQLISPNSWIFATPNPTPAQSVCHGTRTNIMLNGTGLLRVTPECTISTSEYILTPQLYQDVEFPVYVTPFIPTRNITENSNIKFHLNVSTIVPTTNEFSALVNEQQEVLTSIDNSYWKVIQHHGTTAGVTIFTTSLLLGTALIVYYMRKRLCKTIQVENPPSRSNWFDEHQI